MAGLLATRRAGADLQLSEHPFGQTSMIPPWRRRKMMIVVPAPSLFIDILLFTPPLLAIPIIKRRRQQQLFDRHQPAASSSSAPPIDTLPADLLVKVLCNVNHGDLKQLLFVSKALHHAALAAKEMHFAFSTPCAASRSRRRREEESSRVAGDEEAAYSPPDAPRRVRSRVAGAGKEDLASISVSLDALFGSTI